MSCKLAGALPGGVGVVVTTDDGGPGTTARPEQEGELALAWRCRGIRMRREEVDAFELRAALPVADFDRATVGIDPQVAADAGAQSARARAPRGWEQRAVLRVRG
jgi:hypothetical protein